MNVDVECIMNLVKAEADLNVVDGNAVDEVAIAIRISLESFAPL